jgi:hypothetical protein
VVAAPVVAKPPPKVGKGGYVEDDKPLRPPPKKQKAATGGVATFGYSMKDADVELGKIFDELPLEERRKYDGKAELMNARLEMDFVVKEREEEKARRAELRKLELANRDSHLQYLTIPPTEEEVDAMKNAVPEVGQLCKVRFDDGDWYRGMVTTVLVVVSHHKQKKQQLVGAVVGTSSTTATTTTSSSDADVKMLINDEGVLNGALVEEEEKPDKWELKILYEDKQTDTTYYPDPFVTLLPMEQKEEANFAVDMPVAIKSGDAAPVPPPKSTMPLPPTPPPLPATEGVGKVPKNAFDAWHNYRVVQWRNQRLAKKDTVVEEVAVVEVDSAEAQAKALEAEEKQQRALDRKHKQNEGYIDCSAKIYAPAEDAWNHVTCVGYSAKTGMHNFMFTKTKFVELNVDEHVILWDKDRVIPKSEYWRLKPHQIERCLAAAEEHYEQVMHTVKSRGLFHELQDGFDAMRERGFGRYDMTIPAYDTPSFNFLRDGDAPWMSVVKQCLGDECKLIHKGCFLSLPGSHHQVYHQDGVHLNEKKQLSPYAVNVFIPLVDLSIHNGATEFVLGTHILENDAYDRSKLYTPTAPAGTPIIFDYRLGHRGMGNSTTEARPILYLTYSADDKFSDETNFSMRRYHKLGSMVEMPVSREERKAKREQELALAKIQKAAKDQQSEAVEGDGGKVAGKVTPTDEDGALMQQEESAMDEI